MKYYKVKPEFDNVQYFTNFCGHWVYKGFLVGNELITETEYLKRFSGCGFRTNIAVSNLFDIVNISKKKTYFSFGARFEIGEQ